MSDQSNGEKVYDSSSSAAGRRVRRALRAAELGLSVALIEKDKLGGTCLHRGCIPTKALLHAAEVADDAREGDKFGVKRLARAGIDMAGVNAYKDGVVASSTRACRAW